MKKLLAALAVIAATVILFIVLLGPARVEGSTGADRGTEVYERLAWGGQRWPCELRDLSGPQRANIVSSGGPNSRARQRPKSEGDHEDAAEQHHQIRVDDHDRPTYR